MGSLEFVGHLLGYCGTLFLGVMAVSYLLPPIVHHIVRRKPPGILNLTYAVLTTLAIVLGVLLINDRTLHQSIEDYAKRFFLDGQVGPRSTVLLLATSLSLIFVLGNVVRSYFNLHRIEEADPADAFAAFIAGFSGGTRAFELILRVVMVVAILFIETQLVDMRRSLDEPLALPRGGQVLAAFHYMWGGAMALYLSLFVWDRFLLRLRHQNVSTDPVKLVITRQAQPVHLCGLSIAFLMYASQLSLTINLADYMAVIAATVSILGSCFLIKSLILDYSIVRDAFRDLTSF